MDGVEKHEGEEYGERMRGRGAETKQRRNGDDDTHPTTAPGFVERQSYSTLVHSKNVNEKSIACNGITQDMLDHAPPFREVADIIFKLLHGQVWMGHNIVNFDLPVRDKSSEEHRAPVCCGGAGLCSVDIPEY